MSGKEQRLNMMTKRQEQVGSWLAGLLTLSGLAFFIFDAIIVFRLQNGQLDISDRFLLPATGLMFVTNFIGFILIRRQNNIRGAWLVFIVSLTIIPVLASLVLKGIYPVALFTTAVFTYIFNSYVFPKAHGRRALIITGVATLSIIGIELWDPAFRPSSTFNAPTFGAAVIALTVLGFIGLILRRAITGSLQSKITTGILFTGGVSILVLAVFAVTRATGLINSLSTRLETTVVLLAEDQLVNQVNAEADSANLFFEGTVQQVKQLSQYRTGLQEQQTALSQGTYWNAEEKLVLMDGGKYGSSKSDISSVFIPSTTEVDGTLQKELNTSAYLDFLAPRLLDENSALLAVYYVTESKAVRYYPNIELASLLPPDFDATTRPYYEITAPLLNPNGITRWTIPYVDAAGGGLVVSAAEPVFLQNKFNGVVVADVQLTTFADRISAIKVGKTGYAFVIDDAGRIISMPPAGYELFGLDPNDINTEEFFEQTVLGLGPTELTAITKRMVAGDNGLHIISINGVDTYITYSHIPSNGYSLAIIVPVAELQTAIGISRNETQEQQRSGIRAAITILVILLTVAVLISFALGRLIAGGVLQLTQAANKILAGDLTARAEVVSDDEIGTLAQAFNAMTGRLREALADLEKTVDERTVELVKVNEVNQRRAAQFQSIAQVARTISSTLDLDSLLNQITNVISYEFNFYHVGIFLLDPTKQYAVLSASNSQGGRKMLEDGHRLKVGEKGLVGFVSSTGRPRVASDTGVDAVFFNNPNLPDTRSEISLPLRAGEEIIGVLDVQSNQTDAFSREDISILSTLADQVSIAIQNARQNEETQSLLAESEALSRQFVQTGWGQFTKRQNLLGLHHTGARAALIYADKNSEGNGDTQKLRGRGSALSLPIKLRDEVIGSVDIRSADNRHWDQDELDIITAIIERAAVAMENSRLIEDAQRRAAREQAIGEMATNIGTYTETEAILRTTVDEIGKKIGGARVTFEFNAQDDKRSKSE